MNLTTNDNLILALCKNNEAKKLLEYARHESKGVEKNIINRLINRCEANETDVIASLTCDKNREIFIKEIRHGDTLQFAYIQKMLFEMSQEKRDMVELIVNSIYKGENIEVVEAV